MTNNQIFKKITGFNKKIQFLLAAVLSVAIFALYQVVLQAMTGKFDNLTAGYMIALPICFFIAKSIFKETAGENPTKDTGAEDFYSEDK